MDKPRILCFEDEESSCVSLGNVLKSDFDFKCSTLPDLDDLPSFLKENWDLYLIDYRFSRYYYSGAELAKMLKAAMTSEAPYVLVTWFKHAKTYLKKIRLYAEIPEIQFIIFKDDLDIESESKEKSIQILHSLIKGFKKIQDKNLTSDRDNILKLLVPPEDHSLIIENLYDSNFHEAFELDDKHEKTQEWHVTKAARWIIGTIMRYPGILYNTLHAATSLGLTSDSLLMKKARKLFEEAEYKGIFAEIGPFWWKDVLHDIAYDLIETANLEPILHESIIKILRSRKIDVKPALCNSSEEEGVTEIGADRVCIITQETMKHEFSYRYIVDDRPPAMDSAYVSLHALNERQEAKEYLIAPEDLPSKGGAE